MWKKLLNTEYFLLFNNNRKIYVTDFISIWSVKFSDKGFLRCLKDSNFGLEMDENDLVIKGRRLLNNPEGLKKVVVKEEGEERNLVVSMTMSFGFLLHLELNLALGSKELFFQRVTSQLLKTVHDLRTSQHELRQLLLKKDKEIAEYKDEKGQIVFRSLKTETFNDEVHMGKHAAYKENFGESDVPECILMKTISVPENEVIEIKEEPSDTQTTRQGNGETADVKTDIVTATNEPSAVKSEARTEMSTESRNGNEIQVSMKTETHLNVKSEIDLSQHHRVASSPSKSKRKKLNY